MSWNYSVSSSLQSTNFPFFERYWSLINTQTFSQLLLLKSPTCNTHLWRNSFLWLQLWTLQLYWCIPSVCLWMGLSYLNSQMHLNTSLSESLTVFQTGLNLSFYSFIQQISLEWLPCSKHCITGVITMKQAHINTSSPHGRHSTGKER